MAHNVFWICAIHTSGLLHLSVPSLRKNFKKEILSWDKFHHWSSINPYSIYPTYKHFVLNPHQVFKVKILKCNTQSQDDLLIFGIHYIEFFINQSKTVILNKNWIFTWKHLWSKFYYNSLNEIPDKSTNTYIYIYTVTINSKVVSHI